MKKLLSLSILLILFVTGAIVFHKMREEKLVYEQRMVAVVDVIKKSLRSVAAGDNLEIDVLAPGVDMQEARGSLVVTGIVGLSSVGRSELFDQFAAVIRNDCEAVLGSDCLRVDMLTVRGSKLIEAGKVVGPIPGMSLNPAQNAARAASMGDAEQAGQPAMAGSVQAGQPAKAGSVQVRQPAKAGSVQAGQPAKAASKQSREPAKAGSSLSSAQFMIAGKRSSAAARGPAGRQRARTPDDGSDARLRVAKIQRALKIIGFDPGPIDNVAGVRTRKAILAYQRNYGLKLDGKASLELLQHLRKASLKLLLHMKRIKGARRSGANR